MNPENSNFEVGRKNPAAGVPIRFGELNIVLLTITTEDRVPWLADSTTHQLLRATWKESTAWIVDDYLLMPDHLQAFCAPRDFSFTIEQWITFWKRDFRRRHGRENWRFQNRGWHHRLRNDEDYSTKWLYVQENPVRKGLVTTIEDWPCKGTVYHLQC